MKRLIPLILTVILLVLCMTGAALAETNQFHFDKTVNSVFVGETLQLELVRAGDCAQDGELTYKSSYNAVATVDENGVVTGVKKGEATITVTLRTDKRAWTTQILVTVRQRPESITLNKTSLNLKVGTYQTLTATVLPANASYKAVIWSSSDPAVAKVSAEGRVTAVSPGTAIITCQNKSCPDVYTEAVVTVYQPVKSIAFTEKSPVVYLDGSIQLAWTVSPADATNPDVTFTSSQPGVATVDESGVITAVKRGTATITARAADGSGVYGTCTVTVCQRPEAITLNKTSLNLKVGGTQSLTAAVLPSTTTDKAVVWTTSDDTVAKVSGSGTVTAVSAGTAVITCQSKNCPEVYAQAHVTVYQPVTSVSFANRSPVVYVGESLQLEWTVSPATATNPDVTFTSSQPGVAAVDENGTVTAVKRGSATITARAADGFGVYGTCTVSVRQRPETISLNKTGFNLKAGGYQTLTATVLPSTAADKTVTWSSSDTSVAKVSSEGRVTGVSVGTAVITCQSKSCPEVYAQAYVTVYQPVTSIAFTNRSPVVYVGESLQLDWNVSPLTATNTDVTFSSDQPGVATVDENGTVTAVKRGTATITARAADGSGTYGTCTVSVRQRPEAITLNKTSLNLKVGGYQTLTATVLPATAADKTVTWSSSDTSVAKVSSEGRVTGVSVGTAVITCQSRSCPEVYAQAYVTVYQPVTSVTFTNKNPYVAVGESLQLNWSVSPMTATDTSVSFSTNKPDVVRVEQDGTVTGLRRGECYVYATANDGSGKKATVKVQVTQPVQGVYIQQESLRVGVGDKATNSAVLYPSDASITRMTWTVEDVNVASVSGTGSRVTVTGRNWGETTVIGVTEDGSYVTTFTVQVGDEYKPLKIAQLYVENEDTIRIQVYNESDMTITRFYYIIETFDAWGNPVICNRNGRSNDFEGYYGYTLAPGDATRHGRFTFGSEFTRPENIAMVTMRITAYRTDDGTTVYIPRENQTRTEWRVKVLGAEEY